MDSCFRKNDNGGRDWIPEAGMTKRTSVKHRETPVRLRSRTYAKAPAFNSFRA
jgi:hypothetical protein